MLYSEKEAEGEGKKRIHRDLHLTLKAKYQCTVELLSTLNLKVVESMDQYSI